jgi:hypothetical protein
VQPGHDEGHRSVLVKFLAELSQLVDDAPTMLVVLPLAPTEILQLEGGDRPAVLAIADVPLGLRDLLVPSPASVVTVVQNGARRVSHPLSYDRGDSGHEQLHALQSRTGIGVRNMRWPG